LLALRGFAEERLDALINEFESFVPRDAHGAVRGRVFRSGALFGMESLRGLVEEKEIEAGVRE
jgi:hypothetical protein